MVGGLSARAQAHVLALYDPDRLKGPRRNLFNETRTNKDTIRVSYEESDKEVVKALKKGKAAILTGSLVSPSLRSLVSQFKKSMGVRHFVYDPMSMEDVRKAQALCYSSKRKIPRYHLERSRLTVSVGADFLGTYLAPTEMTWKFSKTRSAKSSMSQLVVLEGLLSLTGANSDIRKRVNPSDYLTVLMKIAHQLVVVQERGTVPSYFQKALEEYSEKSLPGISESFWSQLAQNLWKHRGRSLILAKSEGSAKEALSVQVVANYLNSLLGNDGQTIHYEKPYKGGYGSHNELKELEKTLMNGTIKTVIIYGTNPVYTSPSFKEALKKARLVVYHGDRIDETGQYSDYILPHPHPMECWGDHECLEGFYQIQQPTLRPLYKTRSLQDSILSWAKKLGPRPGLLASQNHYGLLRNFWRWGIYERHKGSIRKEFDDFWADVLQKGFFDVSSKERRKKLKPRAFKEQSLWQVSRKPSFQEGYELFLYPTIGLRDGTLSNVSWLQEFPDPVTKICWDNYLCISPYEARKRKLKEGQLVELSAEGQTLKVPVHIQPGQADQTLGLALGYGRTFAGELANGVGVNGFLLIPEDGRRQLRASLKVKGKVVSLANVQGHHSMEGRQIVVESTLDDYIENPKSGQHKHKVFSLWKEHPYKGKKWEMSH